VFSVLEIYEQNTVNKAKMRQYGGVTGIKDLVIWKVEKLNFYHKEIKIHDHGVVFLVHTRQRTPQSKLI
jgi:hypothetical protein